MFNFKKAAVGSALVAVLLTGCFGSSTDDVISYNDKVLAGLNSINASMDALFTGLEKELDKEEADIAPVEELLNAKTTEVNASAASIRGLTLPEGDGVKEFSDETGKFITGVDEFMNIMKQYIGAIKEGKEYEKLAAALMAKKTDLAKIYDNVVTKQEEMAKKNNFELK